MSDLRAIIAGLSAIEEAVRPQELTARVGPTDGLVVWAIWAEGIGRYEAESRQDLVRVDPGRGGKSIARIQVRDVLMKGRPFFRGTSTVEVGNAVDRAAADPNVSGILLEIDSPGGTVAGTEALAGKVRAARRKKPVWAAIEDLGASAAYWVASQANSIYATSKTALVGSVGTVLTVYDVSKAAEGQGVRPRVFSTGPLKGAGTPGAPVTDEDAVYFQGLVNEAQTHFDAALRSPMGRGFSAAELNAVKTGGVFPAGEAQRLRLIDGVRSLDSILDALAAAK
jgi:signal peptide peptidase SppA